MCTKCCRAAEEHQCPCPRGGGGRAGRRASRRRRCGRALAARRRRCRRARTASPRSALRRASRSPSAPVGEVEHAVDGRQHRVDVVGDEHDRRPAAPPPLVDQARDDGLLGEVERQQRLVARAAAAGRRRGPGPCAGAAARRRRGGRSARRRSPSRRPRRSHRRSARAPSRPSRPSPSGARRARSARGRARAPAGRGRRRAAGGRNRRARDSPSAGARRDLDVPAVGSSSPSRIGSATSCRRRSDRAPLRTRRARSRGGGPPTVGARRTAAPRSRCERRGDSRAHPARAAASSACACGELPALVALPSSAGSRSLLRSGCRPAAARGSGSSSAAFACVL